MRKWLLLLFIVQVSVCGLGQNTIGIPNIVNYNKMAYQAGSQNWNIVQGRNGILYFANNDGLLSFDGTYWRTYPLPNKTIVRSVAISGDNRIYVGGQKEIGYFFTGANGDLVYTSLNRLLTEKDNDFADIWNICFFNDHVFFRSNKKIFEYYNDKIVTYNSSNWGFLGSVSGKLLAYENDKGLLSFTNGQWLPGIRFGQLPKDNIYLRSALSIGRDSILLVSLVHGLFILHNDTLSSFDTPDLKNIALQNISAACLLSPERIALSTNLAGCIIINKEGKFIQHFTKQEGIQNNNVRTGFLDKDQNLWLGLDNGIDLITYSNAIKNIFPDGEDRNSGYTSVIHDDQLYLGVSTGVYKIRLNNINRDLSYTNGSFELVQNSEGQVWNLAVVNGKLLMGHNKGGYLIENNKAVPIDTKTGFWEFHSLYNEQPSPVLFAGTYSGINFYNDNKGSIINSGLPIQFESARFVAIGKDIIWVAHPYKGIYNITFDKNKVPVATVYKDTRGILSANHNKIFKLKEKIILTTDKGIFEYSEKEKDFVKAAWLEKLTDSLPISYIKEDQRGNIWFCRDRKVGVIDRSAKEPKVFFITEIDNRIMAAGFENINIIDSNNILIAAEKGFFHINYSLYKKTKQPLQVLVRKVQSTLQTDGLIFGGYDSVSVIPSIAYKYNALHFECSSTLYGQEQNTDYSYYLEGFDKGWSAWSKKREKDYTNLPEGSYTFKVKCRNNFDSESPVAGFSFKILPPWYRTWWAWTLYVILFFGFLYLFYKRQHRRYKRLQQLKLQEQQRKYAEEQKQLQLQHQLEIQESEKQIIELRNEKLQSEVQHKNSELASSAMNLVRKKEMLSKLKDDLEQYKGTPEADKSAKEFQKIIRVIDKELDHNTEWEQFAVHFDSVHTNYLKRLKEYCPALSVSDLKLAAYLRLSLSTKEIAQLMTISIRGVETSRYRLRKKLGIDNEVNLFDFLIRVTS
jgi:ligand-binding sensor domain-containing protein/DNA-binding CsgD family transcriptional regulator